MTKRELIARLTWLIACLDAEALAHLYHHAAQRWPWAVRMETRQ